MVLRNLGKLLAPDQVEIQHDTYIFLLIFLTFNNKQSNHYAAKCSIAT
jgi:hypothetical protein